MQQLYSKCKEKINAHAGLDTIRYQFNRMYEGHITEDTCHFIFSTSMH